MKRPHDSWAEVYDSVYREEFGVFYDRLTRVTIGEIGKVVDPPASIVDFGAGTGRLAIPLARAGYRVTAVEPSEPMLRRLQSAAGDLPLSCVNSTMQDFRSASSFDLAICVFTVVAYLIEEAELHLAIESARNCLKPGGQLLLDVPSEAVFADHGCRTARMNRQVTVRAIDEDIYDYGEQIEILGAAGVERVFRDRFRIRAWTPGHVFETARECGLELVEDLSERFEGTGARYFLLSRWD